MWKRIKKWFKWFKGVFSGKEGLPGYYEPGEERESEHTRGRGKNQSLTFGKFLRNYNQMFRFVDNDHKIVAQRLANEKTAAMVHAAAGMATETGEIWDILKKYLGYGKPIDKDHMVEELGDLMWYVWKMSRVINVDLMKIMELNRKKLLKRYSKGFSDEAGLARADKLGEKEE